MLSAAACYQSQPVLSPDDRQSPTTGWKIAFNQSGSNPVFADGVLYVGSADGAVYALDPKTGETRWRFQTGEGLSSGPRVTTVPSGSSFADLLAAGLSALENAQREGIRRVDMTPAIDGGTVFVGSGDQSFYAIDAATGKQKWSYLAGPGMASPSFSSITGPAPTLQGGTVYFVTNDGLHAIDALTGKRKWLFETLQEIPKGKYMPPKRTPTAPVMADGVILLTAWPYVRGNTPRKSFVYAVDPDSGQAKWVHSVDGLDITTAVTSKGLAFFAVDEPTPASTVFAKRVNLYAISTVDGQLKWKFDAEKDFGSAGLLQAANTICFASDKGVFALDPETGRPLWSFKADQISPDLLADAQHLYVVNREQSLMRAQDRLRALALTTGQEKWSKSLKARGAIVHDGVVYVGALAIDAATGKELWSFRGTGRESARLVSEGRVFLTSPTTTYFGTERVDQGYLYAIDAKTGKLTR